MSRVYLDASAGVKLVVTERESAALRRYLDSGATRLSSRVLAVELLRAVRRVDTSLLDQARAVLAVTEFVDLTEEIATSAAALDPATVRSLDAIHLASALALQAELDAFVTYDARQADAARALGLRVEAPG